MKQIKIRILNNVFVQIMKIDHHRGPVTNVKAIQDGEVLVSCSQDGTVCVWSTETFELLNTIHSTNRSPIHMMDLSQDSVFLVTLEGDNEIRLRTFITGTDLHTLKKQKAPVCVICIFQIIFKLLFYTIKYVLFRFRVCVLLKIVLD